MKNLITSAGLKFRWINGQCFEFLFPNGKVLITDPWFHGEGAAYRCCPDNFTAGDLVGGDYLYINHGHFDHTSNIGEVYSRFKSTVIMPSPIALEMARCFDITLTDIYPVDFNGRYYFDGFSIETFHGVHHRIPMNYQETMDEFSSLDTPASPELNAMGSIFNMNFILTTDQGLRIAFIGGNDDGMTERMRGADKPNIVIRNKLFSSKIKTGVAETFAEWFAQVDSQILVPMHYETWLKDDPGFAEKMIEDMNHIMEEKGKVGRVAQMERGKWYSLNLTMTEIH
ncbi:MBL fold metallo-hydrolase [Enterocloster lavalensis]|uniref:MBL fold metallo-hydrolase n=1 Tax=Enterocloster lavalensis TaxID=460384 RepID=UPI0023F3E432|nr:MBL fold metallo-hydrolase [Enterocloster lavalensis]